MKEKTKETILITLILVIFLSLIGCVELNDLFDPWRQVFQKDENSTVELEGFIDGIGTFPSEIIKEEEIIGYIWKDKEKKEGVPLILKEEIKCESKKVKITGIIEKRRFRPSSETMDYMQWLIIKVESYQCLG